MADLLERLDDAIEHARRASDGAAWHSDEVVQLHRLEAIRRMVEDGLPK
jgi:hypothetical protein